MAACWVARLAVGEVSATDLARLRAWLSTEEHRRAFDEARHAWQIFPVIKPAATAPVRPRHRGVAAGQAAASGAWRRRRGAALVGGLAASLIAALLVARIPAGDLCTAKGQVTEVHLADGTTAWLDTDSALNLRYSAGERRVELVRGQVWFDVVHDPSRPFRVTALGGMVTDVGTAFEVERRDGKARVGVSQGVVSFRDGARARLLIAGQSTSWGAHDGSVDRPAAFDPDAALAWRSGRIVLDRRPLAEALDILRRYRPGLIALLDGRAARAVVSGTLFIDRLDQGLDALAASQGLRITRLPFLTLLRSDDGRFGAPAS